MTFSVAVLAMTSWIQERATGTTDSGWSEDNDILIAGVKDQLFGSADDDILFAGKVVTP